MARRPPDRDPVKFPFGESNDDDSDEGRSADDARGASDSDLDGFDDSGSDDVRTPAQRVKFPLGSSGDPSSSAALPNLPPGASPDDDASLDGLDSSEEELVRASDVVPVSDEQPLSRVSDLGPIGASGPLVIIDDEEPDASSRYRASIVDDSARLAGSNEELAPAGRKGKGTKRRSRRPEDEDVDAEVPTPDRSARGSRASTRGAPAAAPPPGKARLVLGVLLALAAVGAALVGGEVRRRADLAAAEARHAKALADLRAELDAARQAERAAADARAAAEARAREELAQATQRAAAERERAVADARRAGEEAGRRQAEQAAREAIDVELARARAEQDEARAREVAEAAERARAEERARGEEALAALKADEAAARRKELEALRKRLEGELDAMTTRAEEEAMARMLAEERAAALDRAAPAGGGSAAEPAPSGGGAADDWDAYFTGGGAGSGGTDNGGDGGEGGDGTAGGGDDTRHPVDKAWSWLKDNVHGSVGYRNLSHFSRGDFRKTRHELRIELEYRDWLWRSEDATTGLRLVSVLDIRADDADYAAGRPRGVDDEERRRPIVWPEELHLDLNVDWLTVKGGWQVYAWGTGDLFNPTDVLNPTDFSDLFDTRRISVLSTSIEAAFEHVSLELVSIPSFTRSRLPLAGDRFDVLGAVSPIPVLRPDDPDAGLTDAQWGARAVAHVGGWDVSLSAFTGWDDLPSPRLSLLSLAPLTIVVDPTFDRIHMLGADFATTLGFLGLKGALGQVLSGIQLHGELAHFWIEGERQDDFLQAVIGFNYTWIDLIAEHDLTLVLEYAGDATTGDATKVLPGIRLNRVLRGAVLGRLEYAVDETLSFEVNAALITFGRENALIHPGVTWSVTDNLRLQLGGDIFLGPRDTFFGQFRDDGRVIADVKWVF